MRPSKKPISRMALSCFSSAIQGRHKELVCNGGGAREGKSLCGSQPFGMFSCWASQKAARELKPCNFQQVDWDSWLFSSRHAVVRNKGVRGGGNRVDATCPVPEQVSLSCGRAQRERQDVQKGEGAGAMWGALREPLTSYSLLSCLAPHTSHE